MNTNNDDRPTTTLRAILETARADGEWSLLGWNVSRLLSDHGDDRVRDLDTPGDVSTFYGWTGLIGITDTYVHHATDSHWLDTLDAADAVELLWTIWGDYVGSDVHRSNHRALLADYAGTLETVRGDYSSEALVWPLDREVPADTAAALVEIIRGLSDDYPLHDEEDHSSLLLDMADDDWQSWAREDARDTYRRALEDAGVDEEDADRQADAADLTAWLGEWREAGQVTWEAESAVSGRFVGLDDALRGMVELFTPRR